MPINKKSNKHKKFNKSNKHDLKIGDTSEAICKTCHQLSHTTYKIRDLEYNGGKASIRNVLVGVCDTCGEIISVPSQTSRLIPKI